MRPRLSQPRYSEILLLSGLPSLLARPPSNHIAANAVPSVPSHVFDSDEEVDPVVDEALQVHGTAGSRGMVHTDTWPEDLTELGIKSSGGHTGFKKQRAVLAHIISVSLTHSTACKSMCSKCQMLIDAAPKTTPVTIATTYVRTIGILYADANSYREPAPTAAPKPVLHAIRAVHATTLIH